MNITPVFALLLFAFLLTACSSTDTNPGANQNNASVADTNTGLDSQASSESDTNTESGPDNPTALVTAVTFSGEPGNYSFSVTIASPDTGCDQYADWWEVISADGNLLYRRILAHSHVDEQPFTRSGGPVDIAAGDEVFIRAHMNNAGYGEQVFSGSIEQGFSPSTLSASFAENLEVVDPLPNNCAF